MKREEKGSYRYGDGGSWVRGPMIGKGGFGSVYMANLKKPRSRYSCLPPVMAVKSAEVSASYTLQKEKEVMFNVQGCPNVLQCFGEEITMGENGEMIYNLLLEYASGGTLARLIKNSGGGALPESDVRRYTRSILRGLNHVHECGYVHCDLKPENILLVPSTTDSAICVAKIADFGLAKRAMHGKRRKLDPYLRGTLLYISPEAVVDGIQQPSSDIWALGCVVLEMLTGRPPWDRGKDLDGKSLLSLIGNAHKLPEIPSHVSKEARDFLKGCFVRKAVYRFTAEMLLDHPFVAGLEDRDEEGEADFEEILDVEGVSTITVLSNTDSELSSSLFSDDQNFTTKEDFTSFIQEDIVGKKLQEVGHSIEEDMHCSFNSLTWLVPRTTENQPAFGITTGV